MKIIDMIDDVIRMLDRLQRFKQESMVAVERKVKRTKRKIMLGAFQGLLYALGGIVFVVGIVLYLTRFFSLDYIMLVLGALLIYVAIMMKVMR